MLVLPNAVKHLKKKIDKYGQTLLVEYLLEKDQKIYCGCHVVFKSTIMCVIKKKNILLNVCYLVLKWKKSNS